MSNSFLKSFTIVFMILIFFILFITCFFGPSILGNSLDTSDEFYSSFDLSAEYVWPTPGYTTITSPFGYRDLPTAGATSYHAGTDIGAPKGSKFVAICDGKITFTGFLGGGGYTITLSVNNMKITYCHVSPTYLVKKGDVVKKGQVIGHVGPKNVYGVPGNQYFDEDGNPTNRCYNRSSLAFGCACR